MNCQVIESRLLEDEQALLDREVREHLDQCPACRRLYRELEEIEELNRDLARSERAPRDFTGQVIEQVSAGSGLTFPLLAGGGILVIVALMAGLGSSPDPGTGESMASQVAPAAAPTSYPLLDQSQPVELDLRYPRVRLYVIDPPTDLSRETNSIIEILPVDQAQTDYLQYVSH